MVYLQAKIIANTFVLFGKRKIVMLLKQYVLMIRGCYLQDAKKVVAVFLKSLLLQRVIKKYDVLSTLC